MPGKVEIRLDRPAILRLQVTTADELARYAAQNIQRRARRRAPVDTGALRKSITTRRVRVGEVASYEIGSSLEYAAYQEWGTGPIYPVRAKVLRFKPKGSSTFIFRPRTRGVPATHFMAKTAATITLADFVR